MKSSQSKFSNKKANSGVESSSKSTPKVSGCCCGSRFSEDEETEAKEEK